MNHADRAAWLASVLAAGLALLAGAALMTSGSARAATPDSAVADPAPSPGELKLSLGRYRLSGPDGVGWGDDVNLRWRKNGRSLWLGVYRDGDVGRQLRLGWDDQWAIPAISVPPALTSLPLQLLPSLQAASGGFFGGSLALQAGEPFYAQMGLGRTNLKPYANLNFDPNDAITLALGWQGEGGRQAVLSVIADDRLGTGQQHHHLTLRWPVPGGLRLSADLLHKQGMGDSGAVNAWGWTLGLDGRQWFARVARDPKQNFSSLDAWRFSGGWRF